MTPDCELTAQGQTDSGHTSYVCRRCGRTAVSLYPPERIHLACRAGRRALTQRPERLAAAQARAELLGLAAQALPFPPAPLAGRLCQASRRLAACLACDTWDPLTGACRHAGACCSARRDWLHGLLSPGSVCPLGRW